MTYCPKCYATKNKLLHTSIKPGLAIYRRRCTSCGFIFITYITDEE